MGDLLSISIGIGLAISLIFSEFFGILGTGLIVPGYLALHIHQPKNLILTLFIAFLSYVTVQMLSYVFIIFGKRKTVLLLLFAYFFGYLFNFEWFPNSEFDLISDVRTIGFIIPGLIAIWFERQGFFETTSVLVIASVLVRLILILIVGEELV